MNPIRAAAPLLAVALIAACAAPTPYQAATERNGFSELKIEDDRFSVSFRGNSRTPRETVETYLLHRAAELTLASGGDWFQVVDRSLETDAETIVQGDPFASPFGYWPSLHPHSRRRFRSAIFFSPFPATARTVRRYEATAEILVRPGAKPEGDPLAYDARQVIENLGPSIKRPEPE